MFKKIDIKKFGLFNSFSWRHSIGDGEFKTVNIIYGRNYSGKTTLSRIFRSIENEEVDQHYPDADFSLLLSNGINIAQNNLRGKPQDLQVRVYNTDFVRDNLSWLYNGDGSIQPFTLLGSLNIEIDRRIKEIEAELGSEQSKNGLIYDLSQKTAVILAKNSSINKLKSELQEKLKEKAKSIKENAAIYGVITYNIKSIQADIPSATKFGILAEDIEYQHKTLLKEESKSNISQLTEQKPKFQEHCQQVNNLLTKEIKPDQPISDLINDSLLQTWVRQGISYHKSKRSNCGFCGNPLPDDLWDKLDAHFSKESEDLRNEITTKIETLKTAKEGVSGYFKFTKDKFYTSLHPAFEKIHGEWEKLKNTYLENLDTLIKQLQAREANIFKPKQALEITDVSDDMLNLFQRINKLVDNHNNKSTSLKKEQEQARLDLRLSEVEKFLSSIDYEQKNKEIEKQEKLATELEDPKRVIQTKIDLLTEERNRLEAQAKDETRGADLVNQHLGRFFGHDGLKLVADGTPPTSRFRVMREGKEANHLSEGECSLIAFCYFIAKIEDELNSNRLTIFIDDPISSLDSNHVFFTFSLIDSLIAKPKKYDQLFISTHNLDFLKYIKRITLPTKKEVAHFLVERQQKGQEARSVLTKMPEHIKNYTTEFNYLFEQIYSAYNKFNNSSGNLEMEISNTYTQFYNLSNNIRKFLECYLFFRFPNTESPLNNLDKLFDVDSATLINRVINENSHLTQLDRAWKPMDIAEIEKCVELVVKKIQEKDLDQFDALVASIR